MVGDIVGLGGGKGLAVGVGEEVGVAVRVGVQVGGGVVGVGEVAAVAVTVVVGVPAGVIVTVSGAVASGQAEDTAGRSGRAPPCPVVRALALERLKPLLPGTEPGCRPAGAEGSVTSGGRNRSGRLDVL